ncbi:unnamed protein product [Effrenium voratum]|nr:unnamed protein product [Effrenium voratum]
MPASPLTNCGYLLSVWAAFGFLHGGHWCVLTCLTEDKAMQKVARAHAMSYAAGIVVTALGGGYCQSGTAKRCPGGEDMSQECLWQEQDLAYQIIYVLHYIGLAWSFTHWVMDGAQLWSWGRQSALGQPLRIVASDVQLSHFRYSGILWFAVLLVSLTWMFFMPWSAGGSSGTLGSLAGVLLLEMLLVQIVACGALCLHSRLRGARKAVEGQGSDTEAARVRGGNAACVSPREKQCG